jgi:DNA-binding FadR family transcriptional regulator
LTKLSFYWYSIGVEDKTIHFKPLKVRRLSELVENYIRELILKDEVKPGQRLPTEKEISEQFGVSVVTVREALRGLEAFGLIEKRRGKDGGIFKTQSQSDSVKIALHNFLTSRHLLASHIAEVRKMIEPPTAEIAASRITSRQIKALEKNVVHCENMIEKTGHAFSEKEFLDIDTKIVDFHRLIAEATHNPILILIVDYAMDSVLSIKRSRLTIDVEFSIKMVVGHRSIVNHIKDHDIEGVGIAMAKHLQDIEDYFAQCGKPKWGDFKSGRREEKHAVA